MKKFKKNAEEKVPDLEVVDAEFEEVNEEEVEEQKKGFKIPKPVLIAGGVAAGLLAIFGISKIGGNSDPDLWTDLDDSDDTEDSDDDVESESTEDSDASADEAEK